MGGAQAVRWVVCGASGSYLLSIFLTIVQVVFSSQDGPEGGSAVPGGEVGRQNRPPAPRFLSSDLTSDLLKQWAAERIHSGLMMAPPQAGMVANWRDTCQGQEWAQDS